MDTVLMYPRKCRQSMRILMNEIGVPADTAYNMMLMTATLMDLNPDDDKVVDMILADCGVEVRA